MTPYAIVTTTVGDEDTAKGLARALLEAKLAACVQITPVESLYRWEGAIEQAQEQLLSCKIVAVDFSAVEREIRARHGYDVPEIVMTPIMAGHPPYLAWLAAATRR